MSCLVLITEPTEGGLRVSSVTVAVAMAAPVVMGVLKPSMRQSIELYRMPTLCSVTNREDM